MRRLCVCCYLYLYKDILFQTLNIRVQRFRGLQAVRGPPAPSNKVIKAAFIVAVKYHQGISKHIIESFKILELWQRVILGLQFLADIILLWLTTKSSSIFSVIISPERLVILMEAIWKTGNHTRLQVFSVKSSFAAFLSSFR